jgi:hypothetical protein
MKIKTKKTNKMCELHISYRKRATRVATGCNTFFSWGGGVKGILNQQYANINK